MYRNTGFKSARKQKGQNLIGIAIGVAIIGLALVGIMVYAARARHGTQVNSEVNFLTTTLGGAQKLYNQDPNGFANVTATALIQNGVIPSANVNGTAIESGFGTPVTVAPDTLYQANDSIDISENVPPSACSDLVQDVASNFAKIVVAGTTVKDTTAGTALSAATLGTSCSGTGGGQVAITFTGTR